MRVAALVPAGFAIGAGACAIVLHYAPRRIAVDLAQPLPVVTYWHGFGALLWLVLLVSTALASCGYVAVLRAPLGLRLRALVAVSAIACAAALAFPIVFSSDVYAYAGYGDMALHGIDPYAHVHIALNDPLARAMIWQWGNPAPTCVYGPAFVWLAQAVVWALQSLGAAAPLWAFRVLACAALVACAPLAYAAFEPFSPRHRLRAAAGIALNPIAIWSCAEGHNDAIAIACILAGFALVVYARAFAGALTIALCALLKAPALAGAAGLVLSSWKRPDIRSRITAGAGLGVLIVLAVAVPLERGVREHLVPAGHYAPHFSPQYLLACIMPLPLAAVIVAGAAFLLAAFGARELLARRRQGAAFIAFAVWAAVPNPYPWYALWIVPLAFLATDVRAMWALLSASLLIVARYYGDATAPLPPALEAFIVALEFGLPLGLMCAAVRTSYARRGRPENRRPAPDFAPLRLR